MTTLRKIAGLLAAGAALVIATLMATSRKRQPAATPIREPVTSPVREPAASADPATPNILLFSIDDLDAETLERMLDAGQLPNIKSKIVDGGVHFSNAIVTTSICSPSRATLLTGKFSHNHGVWHVVGDQGPQRFDSYLATTNNSYLPNWLTSSHYRAFVGKFHLGSQHPDWDFFRPVDGYDQRPGMYRAREGGRDVSPNVFQTKYVGDVAKQAIRASGNRPFFLYVAPMPVHVIISGWHQRADQARANYTGTPVAFSQFANTKTNGWRQHLVTVDFSGGAPAFFWWSRDSNHRDSGWGDWSSSGDASAVAPNTGDGSVVGWNILLPSPTIRRQQLVRQRGNRVEFYSRDVVEGQQTGPWVLAGDESVLDGTGTMPVIGWAAATFPSGAIRQQVVRGNETMGYVSYVRHRHPITGLFSDWRLDPDWGEAVVFGRLGGFSIIPTRGSRYIVKLLLRRPGSNQFEWWQSGEQVDFQELAISGSVDGTARDTTSFDPLEEGDVYLDPAMEYSPAGLTQRDKDRAEEGQGLEAVGPGTIVREVHPYFSMRAFAEGNWSPIAPGQTYNYAGNYPAGRLRANGEPNSFTPVSAKYALPTGKASFNRRIDNSTPFFSEAAWPDLTEPVPGNRTQQDYLGRLVLDRMEQLISIDRMVGEVVDAAGSNTIVILTSDNGHFNGEHRLGNKLAAQEESIRVPLYVRGPDFQPHTETRLVANLDITPTILDFAGHNWESRTLNVDGRSLRPLLENRSNVAWRRTMLLEYHRPRGNIGLNSSTDWRFGLPDYLGLRQFSEDPRINTSYVHYYDDIANLNKISDIELYDMDADPFQTDNLANNKINVLDTLMREFYRTAGRRCRVLDRRGS